MTTARRTRSQVTDEAMAVALRVGVCLGGAFEACRWKRLSLEKLLIAASMVV